MAKTKEKIENDLAESIADALNSNGEKVAYFLGKEESPTDLDSFVSTGSTLLDLAISNRPDAGMAFGRILELNSLEGGGKSLLCAHMMANVQKMGGVSVLIDSEAAINKEFFSAVGLDIQKMIYIQRETVEDIFNDIDKMIEIIRKKDKDKKVIIVVDSLAGASSKVELEGTYDQKGYATQKSIIISQAMRKLTTLISKQNVLLVFTNQLRTKMNAQPFADPYVTSGGKSLAFHASVRIRLSLTGKIKKDDNIIGVSIKANVIKNRIGPPYRIAEFDIFFDRGIDDSASILSFMKQKEMISGDKRKYQYVNKTTGEEYTFSALEWNDFLINNRPAKDEIYKEICKKLIMEYSSNGLSTLDGADVDSSGLEIE